MCSLQECLKYMAASACPTIQTFLQAKSTGGPRSHEQMTTRRAQYMEFVDDNVLQLYDFDLMASAVLTTGEKNYYRRNTCTEAASSQKTLMHRNFTWRTAT